jgi:hypothetical protein
LYKAFIDEASVKAGIMFRYELYTKCPSLDEEKYSSVTKAYVDNFRIRNPSQNVPIDTRIFCSHKNYYMYVCQPKGDNIDIRIGTVRDDIHKSHRYICEENSPRSKVFASELGFTEILKVQCEDFPIIIGKNAKGKNLAAIYDLKIPYLIPGTNIRSPADFITKRNILLDVEEFGDSFNYFDIFSDTLNMDEISGRSNDNLKVAIVQGTRVLDTKKSP